MRLNLGCGYDKREGFISVDKDSACRPDQLVDLEDVPWPWPTDSADEVLLKHTLEHLGATTELYLDVITELWRVCKPGATVRIIVPHPRHDHFLNDPTHVRPVTPAGLELFSQAKNQDWIEKGMSNSALGIRLGIDFDLVSVDMTPDEPWRGRLQRGEIKTADLAAAMRQYNNVILETSVVLRAVKPGSG